MNYIQQHYARINTRPSRKVLLYFGVTLFVVSLVIAMLLHGLFHHDVAARGLAAFAVAVGSCSVIPGVGRVVYVAWMGLGVTLGLVTSPLLLVVIFFLVFTPSAVLLRLCGRDALRRKRMPGEASYWEPYPAQDDKARYLRQF